MMSNTKKMSSNTNSMITPAIRELGEVPKMEINNFTKEKSTPPTFERILPSLKQNNHVQKNACSDTNNNGFKLVSNPLPQDENNSVKKVEHYTTKNSLAIKIKIDQLSGKDIMKHCQQCNTWKNCSYKLTFNDCYTKYLCTESCIIYFHSLGKTINDYLTDTILKYPNTEILVLTCVNCCKQQFNKKESLSWQGMQFCSVDCLSSYQYKICSFCRNCKQEVKERIYIGKYSLRFGSEIRQFCTEECLNNFKIKSHICSVCHKDIGTSNSFQNINKSEMKILCSFACADVCKRLQHDNKNSGTECSYCKKKNNVKVTYIEYNENKKRFYNFCTIQCVIAFKFTSCVDMFQCVNCKYYYNIKEKRYTMISKNVKQIFCSELCQDLYIMKIREVVFCFICKVMKFDIDMIKTGGTKITFCSLNCLLRYQIKFTSNSIKKCDYCSVNSNVNKYLILSNMTHRQFCTYKCKYAYKNQLEDSQKGCTTNSVVPTTLLKKYIVDIVNSHGSILPIISESQSVLQSTTGTEMLNISPAKTTFYKADTCEKEVQTDEIKEETKYTPFLVPAYVPISDISYSESLPSAAIDSKLIPAPTSVIIPLTANINFVKEKEMHVEWSNYTQVIIQNTIKSENLCGTKELIEKIDEHINIKPTLNLTTGFNEIVAINEPHSSLNLTDVVSDTNTVISCPVMKTVYANYMIGIEVLQKWLEKHTASNGSELINTDISIMSTEQLSAVLCLFINDQINIYVPDTIFYFCLEIQNYLIMKERVENIFLDTEFQNFSRSLNKIIKCLADLPYNTEITFSIVEQDLWEFKQLGSYSPYTLLNTIMYFNTKYFKLSSLEQHKNLSFQKIRKHYSRSNNISIRFYYQTSTDNNMLRHFMEIHQYETNKLRCPIELYTLYFRKLPKNRNYNKNTYLQPEKSFTKDSPCWFATNCLDDTQLELMLNRIKLVKEIKLALSSS